MRRPPNPRRRAATHVAPFAGRPGMTSAGDSDLGDGGRRVRVVPLGGAGFLPARAAGDGRADAMGRQGGGRVWPFPRTDAFARDHAALLEAGVTFEEEPRAEAHGRVAVVRDPWGNRRALIGPAAGNRWLPVRFPLAVPGPVL